MLATLREIFQENWMWRRQILNLAVIDLRKRVRGAVLGWTWLFVKPLVYILVFWFALELGLRASSTTGDYPYILWLASGIIPWFFMQSMLNTGSDIYRRYPFLVNRIHFPLSAISNFYALAEFIIFLCLMAGLLLVCLVAGVQLTVYALQLPLIWVMMMFFWVCFSVMTSALSAISKDFSNLLKAFSTPLFWVSGVIYNVANLDIPLLHQIMAFNPITFFVTANRAALCDKFWIWDKPEFLLPFLLVFALTALAALRNYHKLRKDVADVI